ncbi:ATP-grasp domain-containing protein [Myxococcus virescens]|uniref:ATP-grasp domain-containing protein n=1 Tax=Myxococcus virescens TaxID=83456 RepID=UPI003DA3FBB8
MAPRKKVVLIGSRTDDATRYVAEAVERRRASAIIVETERVPDTVTFDWEDGVVHWEKECLSDLRSFYVKNLRLSLPVPEAEALIERNFPRWQEQYLAERERQSFLHSVVRALHRRGCSFVNPMEAVELHYLKLHQLALLARHKVPVPSSLATHSPDAVRAFFARHRNVVYKPLGGGAMVRKLSEADLTDERLTLLGNCPVLFQEQIQGDEFRAYVLAGEPVAAFQIPTEGVVDARQNLEKVRPARLPRAAWDLCVRGAKALGMVFTAVDLRRTPEGAFVALEFNPTPAISFFDDPRDGKVITRLASYLVAQA